jgi:hypothetical protein
LVQNGSGSRGEILIQDPIDGREPVIVAGERRSRFGIPPSSRFGDDCQVNLVDAFLETCLTFGGRKKSVVEKVPMNQVAETRLVFHVVHEFLTEPLGIGFVEGIACRPRTGTIVAPPTTEEGVLGVMSEKFPSGRILSIENAVEIVGTLIAQEGGNGRVEIPAVINDEHVLDQVVLIEQDWVGRVARSVGIAPQAR